jgi:hypothetical protein
MPDPPRLAGFDAPRSRKFLLVTSLLVATPPSTLHSAWLRWQGELYRRRLGRVPQEDRFVRRRELLE